MKKNLRFFLLLSVFLTVCFQTKAAIPTMNVITNVPAYFWYEGCTPTAIAMVFSYWSLKGYTNLFNAQGSALYIRANVQDQICSPAHIAKYKPPGDVNLPVPPNTSIACWLKTSVNPLGYGDTSSTNIIPGITNYSASKGYSFKVSSTNFNLIPAWKMFTNSIALGQPMVFVIDKNGDKLPDHAVTVIGYEDRGGSTNTNKWYACYNADTVGANTVNWYQFTGTATNKLYTVAELYQIIPPLLPPMPKNKGTLILFCSN
ncbi:MAG: hypothetical protein WCK10_02610 [Candidatus Staskawiczbacteria bacterium]